MRKEYHYRSVEKNNMAYDQMGYLYDPFMKNAPYDKWLSFAQEIIKKSGKNIETIADLGCGTGELTLKLSEKGYQLYGVD